MARNALPPFEGGAALDLLIHIPFSFKTGSCAIRESYSTLCQYMSAAGSTGSLHTALNAVRKCFVFERQRGKARRSIRSLPATDAAWNTSELESTVPVLYASFVAKGPDCCNDRQISSVYGYNNSLVNLTKIIWYSLRFYSINVTVLGSSHNVDTWRVR